MDNEWKVLTVDDEKERQDEIKRTLSTRMGGNKFLFTEVNSFDEGIELIKNNRFDLIILDVHEDANDPNPNEKPKDEDQRGEELLKIIKMERFVPVVFYTGYPQKVLHLESPFVRVVTKGTEHTALRDAVDYIVSTGLPELLRHIEEQSRSYMWESLDNVFGDSALEFHPADISLLLARNLANNLSQKVVKEIIGLDGDNINPLEMYQYPPKNEGCNPADIYRKTDGSLWMVLTTACDFEQEKVDNVLMSRITPLKEHHFYIEWSKQKYIYDALEKEKKKEKKSKTPVNVAMGAVKNLVKGFQGDRYKFLPGTFFIEDCIVDFQELIVEPIESVVHYECVCHIDNPYREEMLHLFSRYYGRIGTPDYDIGPIWERIDSVFNVGEIVD